MTDASLLSWADAIPDAALLARYAADRDEAAFALLVRRHGPTVFGACLRNAGHRPDAEDAFQAVFLLLAQRAGELTRPELLGHWLYGVAVRVARKARRSAARRRTHEAKAVRPPLLPLQSAWDDMSPVLDDELLKLSEQHRAAVLLCDVQGVSRADAAARLGIPDGTLSSRLNAARKKLAERLARRGVTLGAGALGGLAAHATAAVPDELTGALARALAAFHTDGAIPAPLADLLTGGRFAMRTKLLALLTAVALGSVGALAAWPGDAPKPTPDPKPKADPPKAELPKAELPKEDFGRPPRDKRPKLLEKFETDSRMEYPAWSPDGARLYLSSAARKEWGGSDYVRNFESIGVKLVLPPNHTAFVGLVDGGKEYATFSSGGGVNAVSELVGWNVSAVGARGENVKRLWSVEIDREDGRPVAITDDRKYIFTRITEANAARFRVLDGKTGEPLRELVKPADNETLGGWAFSADAARLFLAVSTEKGHRLRAIDTATGKVVWDREADYAAIPRPFPPGPPVKRVVPGAEEKAAGWKYPTRVTLVSSGKWLGVTAIQANDDARMELPNAICLLVDASTGKDGAPLAELGNGDNTIQSLSADGKLAVGEKVLLEQEPRQAGGGFGPGTISVRSRRLLMVWSTETGKVLKAWPTDTRVSASFSPKSPLLAIVEMSSVRERIDANSTRTSLHTTLGFWDLSGLLK